MASGGLAAGSLSKGVLARSPSPMESGGHPVASWRREALSELTESVSPLYTLLFLRLCDLLGVAKAGDGEGANTEAASGPSNMV